MAEKQGIDWTTLWKKDDWMSVWIGFIILIFFLAGSTFKLPSWRWMSDGAFGEKIGGYQKRVEAIAKDATAKGDAA
ncbi:MAG: putative rane protein, partial [Deltaproteobacteria bacterium]|nr:putative rane protein [Deltaproteobacteria bacterium]